MATSILGQNLTHTHTHVNAESWKACVVKNTFTAHEVFLFFFAFHVNNRYISRRTASFSWTQGRRWMEIFVWRTLLLIVHKYVAL